jgi:drug/metabolite transporter (DMT)-like permease
LFIRFAQADAPSLVIAAGRMAIAVVMLAPFALKQAVPEIRALPKRTLLLLLLAGIFLGLHFAAWISSLEFTSVASSVVLVTTAPLWVALLSPFFLNEKITSWVLAGLVVSLTGSVIVGLNGACSISSSGFNCSSLGEFFQGRGSLGNMLALAGAFLSAGYLMVGRRVRSGLTLLTYTFVVYGIAALVLLLLVAIRGYSFTGFPGQVYLWILLLAAVPQILGHSIFNYLLKYLSASYVSIALLGEPVGTVILAYFFLRESPSWMEVFGGLLILAGIAVATRTQKKEVVLPE